MKYERAKAEIISFDGNNFMTFSGSKDVIHRFPDGPIVVNGKVFDCVNVRAQWYVDHWQVNCGTVTWPNGMESKWTNFACDSF